MYYLGELVFWPVCKGHLTDVGDPVPAGCNPNATGIFAEGLRIPPVKLLDRGKGRGRPRPRPSSNHNNHTIRTDRELQPWLDLWIIHRSWSFRIGLCQPISAWAGCR
ncbi:hypothetical protein GCM10017635_19740 [Paracoccus kondratievae]|uniref:Hydantoinase B/oxoprolinase domain-containing protein n=1 Tax=Paracoccus kondratievae TaxID=135740 RepID=A0AAD3P098_9RHOB|nr:hypothetical protein GCM10017635_19740 [Paracoccus kondratievae]